MSSSDVRPGFYSKLNPRAKETIARSAVARSSFDINSDLAQSASDFSKDHPRTCDICKRPETALNPVLVCSSCKVFDLKCSFEIFIEVVIEHFCMFAGQSDIYYCFFPNSLWVADCSTFGLLS